MPERAAATVAGPSHGATASRRTRTERFRLVAYWLATLLVAQENAAGWLWGWLKLEYVRANLVHLGYPPYFESIVGFWQGPGAVALLVPGFGRLKEWAYAGMFFNYSAAVFSHMSVGDGPDRWGAPLGFMILTLASWALRPPDRRPPPGAAPEKRLIAWAVPIVIIVLMLIIAALTLPKAPASG
jgi:hypothetical protein